jgi:hypothetical protein
MFWGMAFTILFIGAGRVTGQELFYIASIYAFGLAGACSAIAGLGCKIGQED